MAEDGGLKISSLFHDVVAGKSHVGLVWESNPAKALSLEVPFRVQSRAVAGGSGKGRARALDRTGLDLREPAVLTPGGWKSDRRPLRRGGS